MKIAMTFEINCFWDVSLWLWVELQPMTSLIKHIIYVSIWLLLQHEYEAKSRYILLLALSPASERKSQYFWLEFLFQDSRAIWSNFEKSFSLFRTVELSIKDVLTSTRASEISRADSIPLFFVAYISDCSIHSVSFGVWFVIVALWNGWTMTLSIYRASSFTLVADTRWW